MWLVTRGLFDTWTQIDSLKDPEMRTAVCVTWVPGDEVPDLDSNNIEPASDCGPAPGDSE